MPQPKYYVGYYYDHHNEDQIVLMSKSIDPDRDQMAKKAIHIMQQADQMPAETTLTDHDYFDDLLTIGGNYVVLTDNDLNVLNRH